MFYIYIFMNINEYFTLTQSVNKVHYGIYSYTKCMTKPFTSTTLVQTRTKPKYTKKFVKSVGS
jgi:hypothetical protein